MKKYRHIALGIVLGMGLSFAFGAHAEVINMIGKTIDGAFSVKLDGKELDNQAIVVEGTSYLPVRAVGEAIGYNVGFDADLGISLTKSVTDSTYTDQQTETNPVRYRKELTPEQKAEKLKNIENSIKSTNEIIEMDQNFLNGYKDMPGKENVVKGFEESIRQKKELLSELEKQKAALSQ